MIRFTCYLISLLIFGLTILTLWAVAPVLFMGGVKLMDKDMGAALLMLLPYFIFIPVLPLYLFTANLSHYFTAVFISLIPAICLALCYTPLKL